MFWKSKLSASSLNLDEVCFLDVETTGLHPVDGHRIIEFALLRFEASAGASGEHICEVLTGLVNPEGKKSDASAKRMHRISESALKNSKTFAVQIPTILKFIGDRTIVAHNCAFEEKFLRSEFELAALPMSFEFLDLIALIKADFPNLKSYSLSNLCKDFQIDSRPSHRAEEDVVALYRLIHRVKQVKKVSGIRCF